MCPKFSETVDSVSRKIEHVMNYPVVRGPSPINLIKPLVNYPIARSPPPIIPGESLRQAQGLLSPPERPGSPKSIQYREATRKLFVANPDPSWRDSYKSSISSDFSSSPENTDDDAGKTKTKKQYFHVNGTDEMHLNGTEWSQTAAKAKESSTKSVANAISTAIARFDRSNRTAPKDQKRRPVSVDSEALLIKPSLDEGLWDDEKAAACQEGYMNTSSTTDDTFRITTSPLSSSATSLSEDSLQLSQDDNHLVPTISPTDHQIQATEPSHELAHDLTHEDYEQGSNGLGQLQYICDLGNGTQQLPNVQPFQEIAHHPQRWNCRESRSTPEGSEQTSYGLDQFLYTSDLGEGAHPYCGCSECEHRWREAIIDVIGSAINGSLEWLSS
jgi:hypothetical protein